MPNQLADQTSPYLRQHKDNTVDWYPWGEEALSRAKNENRPIFLSIGYAACHWCHVMAHESFEDPQIAKILNENFISIKVDREERPDLDDIYMQAVVMMTGRGGWPMSVFLTPDLKPFYGGTYFPPTPRYGMPSFKQVLTSVMDAWENRSSDIQENAEKITGSIQSQFESRPSGEGALDLDAIVQGLYVGYDWENGGWGGAPKFPQAMLIDFLNQRAWGGNEQAKELVRDVLEKMARGGLYDLVGGGFHRYSTDAEWLVPHFEKMLYDNALLALAYLHGFAVTGNPQFRQVAVQTLEFIQREMTHPGGGFYASLDADTPQGEGRFYTWRFETLKSHLSDSDFQLLQKVTSISPQGNFEEGLNVLQYRKDLNALAKEMNTPLEALIRQLQRVYTQLRVQRAGRIPPGVDHKIITFWNALAIQAFSAAGLLLKRDDFLRSARKAADFILNQMRTSSGEIQRSWSQGKASHPGTLSDVAALILALHAVYEIDFSPEIYGVMLDLYQHMQKAFSAQNALYFDTAKSVRDLIVRPRSTQDNATPSGNALAAKVHWLLFNYEHTPTHQRRLRNMITAMSPQIQQHPTSYGYWLKVADLGAQKETQIALVTSGPKETLKDFLDHYHQSYHPYTIAAARSTSEDAGGVIPDLLQDRPPLENLPTAYVCQAFTCQAPTTTLKDFIEAFG